jgi:hypothetical protein
VAASAETIAPTATAGKRAPERLLEAQHALINSGDVARRCRIIIGVAPAHQASSRELAWCVTPPGCHADTPAVLVSDVQTLHAVEETRLRTPTQRQLRAWRVAGMRNPNIPTCTGQTRRSSRSFLHRTVRALGTATERLTMNTRISYRYADKTNCKQFTAIVVDGTITWEQIAPYLATQQSFIPGQIGLEDLQYRFALPGKDHPWHQITSEDIRPTEAKPTIALSGEELAWRLAHTTWDASQRTAPALFKQAIIESTPPTRTPAEMLHAIKHMYAQDKQPSEIGAVGTPARQPSVRRK